MSALNKIDRMIRSYRRDNPRGQNDPTIAIPATLALAGYFELKLDRHRNNGYSPHVPSLKENSFEFQGWKVLYCSEKYPGICLSAELALHEYANSQGGSNTHYQEIVIEGNDNYPPRYSIASKQPLTFDNNQPIDQTSQKVVFNYKKIGDEFDV